ncbi:serine hydrolase domain-containing protein [Wenzhouxiangella sediminis]|uniref:Class A beta-lactamase-related serine hydrolase n=1 Tax=Wenzhouxiangella sediminis TaxID=1792836 RepID=A0A3E1K6A4_9GAMM|nr:serine hydrolase domain-containing protein [Wenzhouxiangella sediminis]RFF29498.1 class A beta-lactamase-related serine hydrolase [Wenzhouxiangella sediminis]
MRKSILLTGLAVIFGLCAMQEARPENALPPEALQQQIAGQMERARVPGLAIASIENGRVAWQAAFGERAPGKALNTDTVFNAASLTKPVFAVTALHLVDEGEMTLDQSLGDLWVDPDLADDPRHEQLTPRILLSHQSGLPNWRGNRQLQFMFPPGTRHEYSGEGFEYLRRAIERSTEASISALTAEYVFEPASMTRTTMGWTDTIGDNVARGYNEAGEPIDTSLDERRPNAAAHLMTTVGDYASFLAWVAEGAELSQELVEEMQSPQALHDDPAEHFGLGWKLIPLGNSQALMHDGREPGVRTLAIVHPETGEGLVILTSSSNGELVYRPLIKAALDNGERIVQSMDRLVWRYLEHLPPQALEPMSRGISRSPSFLSKLLHAVDTALVQQSGLSASDKAVASRAVDPYVFAVLEGKMEIEQVERLVERLLVVDGEVKRLVTGFDSDAAEAWLNALQDI